MLIFSLQHNSRCCRKHQAFNPLAGKIPLAAQPGDCLLWREGCYGAKADFEPYADEAKRLKPPVLDLAG
jgi:hypothetical protein